MKNKKAIMLSIAIIGFLTALTIIFTIGASKEMKDKTEYVGKNALLVMQKAQEAENDLLVRDIEANFAFYQAIFELNKNGGFQGIDLGGRCGNYLNTNLWNYYESSGDDNFKLHECYPTSFKFDLIPLFKKYFAWRNEYNFDIVENNFVGLAKETFRYGDEIISYSVKPDFKVFYDFSYDKIIPAAKKMVDECPTSTVGVKECIKRVTDVFNSRNTDIRISVMDTGHVANYLFDAINKQRILVDTTKVATTNVKFALHLPDLRKK